MSNNTFVYGPEDKIAPIPAKEAEVQTIVAEPWLKVEQTCFSDLEGTNFDRDGKLWFVEAGGPASKLHRVDCDTKEDVVVYEDPEHRAMSAVKPHKNGRIYIPSVGPVFEKGYVFSCNPDGSDYRVELEGHIVDDMCFDSKGGYYYTHMHGNVSDPDGGVYYVAPDGSVTPLLDKLCCPTIAASGSEVSNVAVIANHEKMAKLDYRSDNLRPVAVFTDPSYTFTVPHFPTAFGILDIMSHSYEGYFSHSTGSMQDGISETIQKTCIEHGRKVMMVPGDYESRAQLLWAAQLAIAHLADQGRNFVGNIHATERAVSNYFGFPHGAGIAIVSLAWFKYALTDQTAYRFARWAKNVWGVDPSLDDMSAAREGIRLYEEFMKELGAPTRLSESRLEVSKELVEKCADEVWESYDCSTWFRPLTSKQQLLDFMMLAWE